MPPTALDSVIARLRRAADDAPTDRELLDRFTAAGDEPAFAALVRRHGGRVLATCRQVLADPADVDDAFQATFLVLVGKARSVRWRASVGGWLTAVAHRVAVRARDAARRRSRHEDRAAAAAGVAVPGADPSWREACGILHAEVDRLPDRYRLPLVLCYLRGLTRDEAAAELGWSVQAVKGRLERGRNRLRERLVRRGVGLSVGLLAAVAVPVGAAVPPALARAAVQAAGGPAPARVAALAAAARVVSVGPAVVASGLAVVVGVLIAGGTVGRRAEPPPHRPQAAPAAVPPRPAQDSVAYGGRVVGPGGTPVAGANVYFHFVTHDAAPMPVRGVTDAQGRFAFALTPGDVPPAAAAADHDPRQNGQVVAKADGFTFGWQVVTPPRAGDLELRLARDDTPVEGRVIDLQGRPVAGLRVSVTGAAAPAAGDLGPFLKALQGGEGVYAALFGHAPNYLCNPMTGGRPPELLPAASTDADGRFRLSGFAPERVVELRIEGAGVETQNVAVLHRPAAGGPGRPLTLPLVKDPVMGTDGRRIAVLGDGFVHPVPPGQTVVGTVRDEATGEPIPGAVAETYQLAGTNLAQNTLYHATADARGRYRLAGLPRGTGNRIRVRPPRELAYLPLVKDVPAAAPFADTTVDAALRRGVRVHVTATDAATGKPVPGLVSYFALPPQRTFIPPAGADAYDNFMPTQTDGSLQFVAAPRKAVVAFRTDWEKYPIAREAGTIWLPSGLSPTNYAAFAPIDPKPGDGPVRVEFKLDARRVVTGKVVGPDGRPVAGARAAPLRSDWPFSDMAQGLKADEFTALGLDPARPRLVCFVHRERKLAGSVVVRGDEAGPVTVRLQPWAAVTGRLLDAAGKPVANARMIFTEVPVGQPGRPMSLDTGLDLVVRAAGQPDLDPKTDDKGAFRVEGLVPGLKYNLALYDDAGAVGFDQIRWTGLAFCGLVLTPGESKDLGDVRPQPFPKD